MLDSIILTDNMNTTEDANATVKLSNNIIELINRDFGSNLSQHSEYLTYSIIKVETKLYLRLNKSFTVIRLRTKKNYTSTIIRFISQN